MSCKAVAEVGGGGQAQGPDGEAYESEHQSSASIVVCCSIPMWIGCFNRRLLFSWLFVYSNYIQTCFTVFALMITRGTISYA